MPDKGISEIFGINVFNEAVMKERLPGDVYRALKSTVKAGEQLDQSIAQIVANAMKDWAVSKGATHYCHWFQPMTGITAEKHDAFITPTGDGHVVMEFSGKELIKGEPDASSFPSGGLRNTFEARGYTAWDPTSYAFIKGKTLYIPTAFCSYSGEVLDKKTPLLRSMQALNKQAMRVLKALGSSATHVTPTVGPEQEYFLIDKELFYKRRDLLVTGRTLFGAKPAKGQEMDDHYFGAIKDRIACYMSDVDEELWKLGVLSKTKHNETAPAQHELAPLFSTTNIATDHNQIIMETLKKTAARHGLVCLLHEKPFAGINGSGKHNNWSLGSDTDGNLLDPGEDPASNVRFLLFLCAVVRAVDEYGDMLRVTAASAGNDHRLGASEAPPAIISIFLGTDITDILESIADDKACIPNGACSINSGVGSLPLLPKDSTDRNRTSPFAFTGNKFEYRMVGASQSIAGVNFTINTIVAEILSRFADRLENAEDVQSEAMAIIKEVAVQNRRIIFNGNNYSEEWVQEAQRRGLPNLRSTIEALPAFVSEKTIALFERHGILNATEIYSRYEILLEEYIKIINIEALTMLEMAHREIVPAVQAFSRQMFDALAAKKVSGLPLPLEREEQACIKLTALFDLLLRRTQELEEELTKAREQAGALEIARYVHAHVLPSMQALRCVADELETLVDSRSWPFPTYTDLLFRI